MERPLSPRRLERMTALPPTRNMQLLMRNARSLPWYQFSVMHSVLTTSARVLGRVLCHVATPGKGESCQWAGGRCGGGGRGVTRERTAALGWPHRQK